MSAGDEAPSVLEAGGHRLEYRWIGARESSTPTLVFLHEGLGCASLWRDFPDLIARDTGCPALIYSRQGYGRSDPIDSPRTVQFMHDEALTVLPGMLAHFALADVILVGHSDGASIALIHAAHQLSARPPDPHAPRLHALVLEAPHVFVEPICVQSIARLEREYGTTGLRERLMRHHGDNTDSMFHSWTGVWLRPEFRDWNIEALLPAIDVPVLVIQGEEDEYGTTRQVDALMTRVSGPVEAHVLPHCGHAPHRDQPERVRAAMTRFLHSVLSHR